MPHQREDPARNFAPCPTHHRLHAWRTRVRLTRMRTPAMYPAVLRLDDFSSSLLLKPGSILKCTGLTVCHRRNKTTIPFHQRLMRHDRFRSGISPRNSWKEDVGSCTLNEKSRSMRSAFLMFVAGRPGTRESPPRVRRAHTSSGDNSKRSPLLASIVIPPDQHAGLYRRNESAGVSVSKTMTASGPQAEHGLRSAAR